MAKFWELLSESVIVQAAVTLMLVGTICYLYLTDKSVPDPLVNILMIVLGYWFGTKTQQVIERRAK